MAWRNASVNTANRPSSSASSSTIPVIGAGGAVATESCPPVGSQPSQPENTRSSSKPTQNSGSAMPETARMRTR